MLKVGLIGTGFIGSAHATNITRHPATTLAAVHDVVLDRAKSVAGKMGARPVEDVQELFDDKGIDAIFITSTTRTHVDYLRRCAKAGKAVYCEKPIGRVGNKPSAFYSPRANKSNREKIIATSPRGRKRIGNP